MAPIKNPFSKFNKVYYTEKEKIIMDFIEANKSEEKGQETFEKLVDELISNIEDNASLRRKQKEGQYGSILHLLTWNGGVNKKVMDRLLEFFNCD